MKKLLLFLLIIIFASCSDNMNEDTDNRSREQVINKDRNLSSKKLFGSALAKVLAENKDVRNLIKVEAGKQINYDYDVLYQLVKDEELSCGKTFRELLSNYIPLDDLILIEEKMPTLTIFVPELPNDIFSANSWETETQIPLVGIRTSEMNDVPIIDSDGNEFILESQYVPGFPVVVVKENERITVENNKNSLKSSPNSTLKFVDDIFCNTSSGTFDEKYISKSRNRPTRIKHNTDKAIESFDIYTGTDGWHRDYIYYNITPTTQRGKFNSNFKEHIVAFEMVGDPVGCLNKIADQTNDPRKVTVSSKNRSGWTDGEFEFKTTVYVGSKAGFGDKIITHFRIPLHQLFYFTYDNIGVDKNGFPVYSNKSRPIHRRTNLVIPLFEWNLEIYSPTIKIAIEEVDGIEVVTSTATTTSEFATNFGIDVNISPSDAVKIGGKFGGSTKETRVNSFSIVKTLGNDELGEVIVNFYDNILRERYPIRISDPNTPTLLYTGDDFSAKYSTGWYRLFIAPLPSEYPTKPARQ